MKINEISPGLMDLPSKYDKMFQNLLVNGSCSKIDKMYKDEPNM